jgi:hypothetical protein
VHHVRDTTFAEDASRSGPDTARKTWPRFETSRSTPCGTPATTAPLPEASYTPFTRPLDLLAPILTCDAT